MVGQKLLLISPSHLHEYPTKSSKRLIDPHDFDGCFILWVNFITTSLFSLTGIMVRIREIIPKWPQDSGEWNMIIYPDIKSHIYIYIYIYTGWWFGTILLSIKYLSTRTTINMGGNVAASWSIENPEFLHDLEAGAVTSCYFLQEAEEPTSKTLWLL